MQRKAIAVHLLTSEAGNTHWELRRVQDGTLIADSMSEGEFGIFANEAGAMADALKIAAVYLEHGPSATLIRG